MNESFAHLGRAFLAEAWQSRFVARDGSETVLGWAALSPVSQRACYSGVAEAGVYVAIAAQG